MGDSWVTLQLPHSEEAVSDSLLKDSLQSVLPDLEVFIPVLQYKDRRGTYKYSLFDGYVFARGPYTDGDYLRLSSSPYVYKVLTYPGHKDCKPSVAYTPHAKIEGMRAQLQDMVPSGFSEGDLVLVTDGVYRDLKGKMMGTDGEDVLVEIYMPVGSLTKLTSVPKMFLQRDEGEDE